jgi:phage terminase small subunit
MTGPLRNVRHERFVQALFEGQDATAAYAAAGFSKDDGNATRLRNRPAVQERLAELQAEVAKDTKVTSRAFAASWMRLTRSLRRRVKPRPWSAPPHYGQSSLG